MSEEPEVKLESGFQFEVKSSDLVRSVLQNPTITPQILPNGSVWTPSSNDPEPPPKIEDVSFDDYIATAMKSSIPLQPIVLYFDAYNTKTSVLEEMGIMGFVDEVNKVFYDVNGKPVNIRGFNEAFKKAFPALPQPAVV